MTKSMLDTAKARAAIKAAMEAIVHLDPEAARLTSAHAHLKAAMAELDAWTIQAAGAELAGTYQNRPTT